MRSAERKLSPEIEAGIARIAAWKALGRSVEDMMRYDEEARGAVVVRPGERAWLSAEDWNASCVVSIRGKRVRLVAILAKNPGHGAFRRLAVAIIEAGMVPCVVCPSPAMEATLKRWQWRMRIRGYGIDQEEFFEPMKGRDQWKG